MSRIISVSLKNFKGIGHEAQTIELAPVTLLFGPNSAGKSTFLHSLIYLREILLNDNFDLHKSQFAGDWIDFGGFGNIVHNRDKKRTIEISVKLKWPLEFDSVHSNSFRNLKLGSVWEVKNSGDSMKTVGLEEGMFKEYRKLSDHKVLGLPDPNYIFRGVKDAEIALTIGFDSKASAASIMKYEVKMNGESIGQISKASPDSQHPGPKINDLFLESDIFNQSCKGMPHNSSLRQVLGDLLSPVEMLEDHKQLKRIVFQSRKGTEGPFCLRDLGLERLLEYSLEASSLPRAFLRVLLDTIDNSDFPKGEFELARKAIFSAWVESKHSPLPPVQVNSQTEALPHCRRGLQTELSRQLHNRWNEPLEEWATGGYESDDLLNYFQSMVSAAFSAPLSALVGELGNLDHLGPVRAFPPKEISSKMKMGSSWSEGLAAWEKLPNSSKNVIERINLWLGEGFIDCGYELIQEKYVEIADAKLSEIRANLDGDKDLFDKVIATCQTESRILLKDKKSGEIVLPEDVGVGISQLVPVIILALTKDSGIASIEQPELHIHPRLQLQIADLIFGRALYSKTMREGLSFIIETHSEHLLLRMLRRIREKALPNDPDRRTIGKDDLSVYYVERTENGTEYIPLHVTEDGDFENEWPQGFFDERDDEFF